jgi:hypothetical protein
MNAMISPSPESSRLEGEERKEERTFRGVGEYPNLIEGYHGCPPGAAIVALNCGKLCPYSRKNRFLTVKPEQGFKPGSHGGRT